MHQVAKILIVDDNPNIHEILRDLFSSSGDASTSYITLHADNGRAALEILVKNPDTKAIILDLNMPVMDGFETLTHIRYDFSLLAIPVCVFSGSKDDSMKALILGASDFINKPGDYQEIKIRVLNLIKNKQQAEAGNRSKKIFLSNLNHELRTPMNGVIGFTQILQTTALSADQSNYVGLIEQSAMKMMTLISEIFSFLESDTLKQNLPQKPFSLRAIVQETINNLTSKAATKNNTPTVYIHPDIPDNLFGFQDKIQEIFYHLLSNTIKFSPSGESSVVIKPGNRDAGSILLNCSVTDTGCGISPETQPLIFEPFTQADGSSTRKFGGLGIGLSIASRIVQMMGGAISVECPPEGGSIFSFTVTCSLEQSIS